MSIRGKAIAIGIWLLLVAVGALGPGLQPRITAALAQGPTPSGGMNGMGMMGGPFSPAARPISMEQAVQTLRQWPAAHHLDDLVLDEVEAYTQNFYGQFKERSTGRGAVQLLVDRYTGRVAPEMVGMLSVSAQSGQVWYHTWHGEFLEKREIQ